MFLLPLTDQTQYSAIWPHKSMAVQLFPILVAIRASRGSQNGSVSNPLPTKAYHSHPVQHREDAPLLRQAPRQLIIINPPVAVRNQQSVQELLALMSEPFGVHLVLAPKRYRPIKRIGSHSDSLSV
jgi:hypothetical protein